MGLIGCHGSIMSRTTKVLWLGCVLASAAAVVTAQPPAPSRPPTPQFRAGVTMVPVDVRVLDRRGLPVTDLTQHDFTVFEDDVPQVIQEFLRAELAPEPAAVAVPLSSGPMALASSSIAPQNRRVFLIVLGRGRQTGPVKVFEALTSFVRERLLPQDQVAVIGYNRATDFTTDHASIAALLDRYGDAHTEIEALIAQNQNLVMGVLDPADMPVFIQNRIDDIFGTGLYGGRSLPMPSAAWPRDEARAALMAQRAGQERTEAARLDARDAALPGLSTAMDDGLLGQYYEDYLGHAVSALTDLGNVHKGFDYLRHVQGEKHLLLVTVEGDLGLWDTRDEDRLAALASDARVAFDLIHTGGVVAAPPAGARGPIAPVPTAAQVFNQTFKVKGIRALAELSGGQAWAFQAGAHAMRRLDLATRFQYLLGYVPANAEWDGAYRRIRIKVNRPDVNVLYRHGYYALSVEAPADRGRSPAPTDQYRRE